MVAIECLTPGEFSKIQIQVLGFSRKFRSGKLTDGKGLKKMRFEAGPTAWRPRTAGHDARSQRLRQNDVIRARFLSTALLPFARCRPYLRLLLGRHGARRRIPTRHRSASVRVRRLPAKLHWYCFGLFWFRGRHLSPHDPARMLPANLLLRLKYGTNDDGYWDLAQFEDQVVALVYASEKLHLNNQIVLEVDWLQVHAKKQPGVLYVSDIGLLVGGEQQNQTAMRALSSRRAACGAGILQRPLA